MNNKKLLIVGFYILLACLYIASLFLNVFSLIESSDFSEIPGRVTAPATGLFVLLTGWMGVIANVMLVGWYANIFIIPIIIFEFFRIKVKEVAVPLFLIGVMILVFSISSFFTIGQQFQTDEAGVMKSQITGFGPGFYLWNSAMLLFFVYSLVIVVQYFRSGGKH